MSKRIRQAHQLMVEGLEDRRVMSALSMLSQLVDGPAQAAYLPPGLVKNESHLLAVHQNDNSGSDKHASESSTATFIASDNALSEVTATVRSENHGQSKKVDLDRSTSLSTSSASSLSTPLAQLSIVSIENITVRDAKLELRIDKADSQNNQSDNSSSVPVSVRIATGLWDSAPVGPVRIVITVERVHTETSVESASHAVAAAAQAAQAKGDQSGVAFPIPTGQPAFLSGNTPERVNGQPVGVPTNTIVEEGTRLIGAPGWLGRLNTPETEEARAIRAASSVGSTEVHWVPSSSASDARSDETNDTIDQVSNFSPQSGFMAAPMATNDPTLGVAIQQFLDQLDEIGTELSRSLAKNPWAAWLLAGTLSVAAIELTRRRFHRRRTRVALAGVRDESLSWVPGLPGPFSTEEL
jgi:hypothetical protein